ncbi:Uncharacterized protein TCM_041934 [Theobroma cacao]|uniref:Uncharacterized protein n=1 Tax=Theobroma cacao TaxID=3641 RepID=A0A061H054_THECC|nr:Uncharacterized protein TCM_041934 [Theobroma cacao]
MFNGHGYSIRWVGDENYIQHGESVEKRKSAAAIATTNAGQARRANMPNGKPQAGDKQRQETNNVMAQSFVNDFRVNIQVEQSAGEELRLGRGYKPVDFWVG